MAKDRVSTGIEQANDWRVESVFPVANVVVAR
jgi:hypothetical protein